MNSDLTDMVNEVKNKVILHWNYRGLAELPKVIRNYGGHIREIYLKSNRLTSLPTWIIELLNLTNMYLHDNCIERLPMQFGQMSQLYVLDLSANKLQLLPPCICKLEKLKSLFLNDNFIQHLPLEMSKLENLEILSISGNKLVALPEWIGSLPKLEELIVDDNNLEELPNRLTLAPRLAILSVCSNRLKYLPLNGFLSTPTIRFNLNPCLKYLSLPVLCQLILKTRTITGSSWNSLARGCFEVNNQRDNTSNANIKLNVKAWTIDGEDVDITIELPRQLLAVYNINENKTVSLWELALRQVYCKWYKHVLDICLSPLDIKVFHEPAVYKQVELSKYTKHFVAYNLMENGPISICVNSHCQQPIFTEAWIIVGSSRSVNCIPTIGLLCCRRCAFEYALDMNFQWHIANQ